jgi:hypothetical protein
MRRSMAGLLAADGTATSAIYGAHADARFAWVLLLLGSAAMGASAWLASGGLKTFSGIPIRGMSTSGWPKALLPNFTVCPSF